MVRKFAFGCWQDDSIIPKATTTKSKQSDGFLVKYRFRSKLEKPTASNGDSHNDVVVLYAFSWMSLEKLNYFFEEDRETRVAHLSFYLYRACLPQSVIGAILDEVTRFAHSIWNDDKIVGRPKVFPIVMDIVSTIVQRPDESEDEAIARATRESMGIYNSMPSTKSSIEALEQIVLDDDMCSGEECVICLETLPVGAPVTRMPCSHLYHGFCIVSWLEVSHFCPICRFSMPH